MNVKKVNGQSVLNEPADWP